MRLFGWFRRRESAQLEIPRFDPVEVREVLMPPPRDPGIEVNEVDASNVADADLDALRAAQSATGMHRVWRRLTGHADPPA